MVPRNIRGVSPVIGAALLLGVVVILFALISAGVILSPSQTVPAEVEISEAQSGTVTVASTDMGNADAIRVEYKTQDGSTAEKTLTARPESIKLNDVAADSPIRVISEHGDTEELVRTYTPTEGPNFYDVDVQVVDASTGDPIEASEVELTPQPNGGIVEGTTVTAEASAPGYSPTKTSVEVTDDNTQITLELEPQSGPDVTCSEGDITFVDNPAEHDVEFEGAGSGTTSDPYQITNVWELQCMAFNPDAHYELVSDIDASNTSSWDDGAGFMPVRQFSGSFDGQGHEISGLTIDRPTESKVGLFGEVVRPSDARDGQYITSYDETHTDNKHEITFTAEFENENSSDSVTDITITGTYDDASSAEITHDVTQSSGSSSTYTYFNTVSYQGPEYERNLNGIRTSVEINPEENDISIVSYTTDSSQTVVRTPDSPKISVKNLTVSDSSVTGGSQTGGVIGQASELEAENLTYNGTVTGDTRVGGVMGDVLQGDMTNINVNGDISGDDETGGQVGLLIDSTLSQGSTEGSVDGYYMTGGVVGSAVSSTITETGTTATVAGNGRTGGALGHQANTDISQVAVEGDVSTEHGSNIGGLVGHMNEGSTISESYAISTITGNGSGPIGGLVGSTEGTISDSYVAGSVDVSEGDFPEEIKGGVIGEVDDDEAHIESTYWDTNTYSTDVGTVDDEEATVSIEGLTEAEMTGPNTSDHMDLDWSTIWKDESNGYPTLRALSGLR